MHYFRDNYAFSRIYFRVDYSYIYIYIFEIIIGFLMLNNKRKHFLYTHLFFYVLIFKRNKFNFK